MKFESDVGVRTSRQKLESTLKNMLDCESECNSPIARLSSRVFPSRCDPYLRHASLDSEIQGGQRDETVRWLLSVSQRMKLNPETFDLCVSVFDLFLSVVKAHPKYLRCIAVSCLFLAIKCTEEDEAIPPTGSLVRVSGCGCSVAEVLRMERIILNKLDWDLWRCKSPLSFVYIFHALLLQNQTWLDECSMAVTSRLAGYQLSSLAHKLFLCRCSHTLLEFGPSTVALALVSLELGSCTSEWLAATIWLQKLAKVDEVGLIRCREVISRIPYDTLLACRQSSGSASSSFKRKVEIEEDVFDDIKRLYGDEGSPKAAAPATKCSSEAAVAVVLPSPTVSAA